MATARCARVRYGIQGYATGYHGAYIEINTGGTIWASEHNPSGANSVVINSGKLGNKNRKQSVLSSHVKITGGVIPNVEAGPLP